MSYQNVFLIGATGRIGHELFRQVALFDGPDAGHENPTRIVGIANSTHFYVFSRGENMQACVQDMRAFLRQNGTSYTSWQEFTHAVDRAEYTHVAFVDTTDSDEVALDFHIHVIRETTHTMVTANKKPLVTSTSEVFAELTSNTRRYGFRASVMAGAEAVQFLRESVGTLDPVTHIEGCFSGTLAYICNQLQSGKLFSEALRSAYDLGYTEPNPLDDLSGMDVARKIVILARSAGFSLSLVDVQLTPFMPLEPYLDKAPEQILATCTLSDVHFPPHPVGFVPRYQASVQFVDGAYRAMVGLTYVDPQSPLGMITGTKNKILVKTDLMAPDGHVIETAGAGIARTAAGLRRDLYAQLTVPVL